MSPLHFTTYHLFAFLGLTGLTGERPLVVAIGNAGRLQYLTVFGALKTRHYHVSSSHVHTWGTPTSCHTHVDMVYYTDGLLYISCRQQRMELITLYLHVLQCHMVSVLDLLPFLSRPSLLSLVSISPLPLFLPFRSISSFFIFSLSISLLSFSLPLLPGLSPFLNNNNSRRIHNTLVLLSM